MKKYTIVCICQVYNEIEKGNLERFFTYIKPAVDAVVIYDDCSTDGSYEYAKEQTAYVIRGTKNDFSDEINHRQQMLGEALKLKPDFILWLDADEVLTVDAAKKLQILCAYYDEKNVDGIEFHELNLWRSSTWRRIDSLYDDGWFMRLWRVTPDMGFKEIKKGLHLPESSFQSLAKVTERTDELGVLHYGFSSQKSLAYKYLIYRSHGQRGYDLLDRLISEEQLELVPVPKQLFPEGLWKKEDKPKKMDFTESLAYVESYKEQVFRPKYSIACLIYKSVEWLQFAYEQVLKHTDLRDTEFFFVANDADPAVLEYLRDNYIPHYAFNNTPEHQAEWYINNVYRAYNYAAKVAQGDFLVLINSDMAFTPGWLDELKAAYNGKNLIASRLVESGKLRTGLYGIEKDFGRTVSQYREADFLNFAKSIPENTVRDGGLFMPLFVNKRHFLVVGGYPEGNMKAGDDIFKPVMALPGEPQVSGDNVLMQRMATIGVKHQTAMNSIVYHFQCGEKDDETVKQVQKKFEIAVCNDIVTGSMGERVLWDYLLESLPGAYGVDTRLVGTINFEGRAQNYIDHEHPDTSLIIQNATFIGSVDSRRYTVAFLQDDLRSMGRDSSQQEANLHLAGTIVTNSIQTAIAYPDYDFEIIPVGVDANLFKPMDKPALREKYEFGQERIGIFVGSFSEVKGWSKVTMCIENHPEITWIVVSKYEEKYAAPNVRVFNRINQAKLAELLNCADFFMIGSPVETQCLAAIEANLCNLPVVMPLVGIYRDFTPFEREQVGIFGDDLEKGIEQILGRRFAARDLIMHKGLTVDASMAKWHKLIERIIQGITTQSLTKSLADKPKKSQLTYYQYRAEYIVRKRIFQRIFKTEYPLQKFTHQITHPKDTAYQILVDLNLLDFAKRILRKK